MTASSPGPTQRYRCASCGNLTRFDVVGTRRSKRFLHQTLAGEPEIEEEEVLEERLEAVTCRWCGPGGTVEIVDRPAPDQG